METSEITEIVEKVAKKFVCAQCNRAPESILYSEESVCDRTSFNFIFQCHNEEVRMRLHDFEVIDVFNVVASRNRKLRVQLMVFPPKKNKKY